MKITAAILALLAVAALALLGCGGTTQTVTRTVARVANNALEPTTPSRAYCQAQAAKLTRATGCPEIVSSATCKYTQAGVKLCGEEGLAYCTQSENSLSLADAAKHLREALGYIAFRVQAGGPPAPEAEAAVARACGPVFAAASRRAGDYKDARLIEQGEVYLYCARQATGSDSIVQEVKSCERKQDAASRLPGRE
jgi:hypothetical protein